MEVAQRTWEVVSFLFCVSIQFFILAFLRLICSFLVSVARLQCWFNRGSDPRINTGGNGPFCYGIALDDGPSVGRTVRRAY